MGRRYNAERALESARRAELAAWDAYAATADRTREDVDARVSVAPVESPARVARRKVWERAAARVERARETLEALPPAGHKRRKDGTTYPVAGPRENAARAAGRAAFRRAVGRSLTFALVAVAFLGLFFSACN